jgi:hypothetical protein
MLMRIKKVGAVWLMVVRVDKMYGLSKRQKIYAAFDPVTHSFSENDARRRRKKEGEKRGVKWENK